MFQRRLHRGRLDGRPSFKSICFRPESSGRPSSVAKRFGALARVERQHHHAIGIQMKNNAVHHALRRHPWHGDTCNTGSRSVTRMRNVRQHAFHGHRGEGRTISRSRFTRAMSSASRF